MAIIERARGAGKEMGTIWNEILEDADGALHLRFAFELEIPDLTAAEEKEYKEKRATGYLNAVQATRPVGAIPAFARKYKTSCMTCHVAYPKLNAFGEAYRLNGYQIPESTPDHVTGSNSRS